MQFHGKSERGLVKILRCAQDDSVGAWIGVILMGAAVRLHAKSARGPLQKLETLSSFMAKVRAAS